MLALAVSLTAGACGEGVAPGAPPLDSDEVRVSVDPDEASALADVVRAADVVGLELIAGAGAETTVTSPASLQVALSMAAEGAEGRTLAELEAVLGASGQERSDALNALTGALADLDGDPGVVQEDELPATPVVHRAGRLVLDDEVTARQEYVDTLARSYDTPAVTTDLDGEEGKRVLDAWVAEHTGGLVPRSGIRPGPDLRVVLQDAILLAARWEQPFLAALTTKEPFTLASGEQVEVDMMDPGRERPTAYAEVDGWQAVRLPYTGGRLAAEVVLPPEGTAPTTLTPPLLAEILAGLDRGAGRPVILRMPVADVGSTLDLLPWMREHAPSALDGGFGRMAEQDLALTQAVQQAVLTLDEEGTVAAAVTEVAFNDSGPAEPPVRLTVDRPYLVRIADGETGWPLFLAHVADPRGE